MLIFFETLLTEKWSPFEVSVFEASITLNGKNFSRIQKHVSTRHPYGMNIFQVFLSLFKWLTFTDLSYNRFRQKQSRMLSNFTMIGRKLVIIDSGKKIIYQTREMFLQLKGIKIISCTIHFSKSHFFSVHCMYIMYT